MHLPAQPTNERLSAEAMPCLSAHVNLRRVTPRPCMRTQGTLRSTVVEKRLPMEIKIIHCTRTRARRVGDKVTIPTSSSPDALPAPVSPPARRTGLANPLPPFFSPLRLCAQAACLWRIFTPGSSISPPGCCEGCPGAHGSTRGRPDPTAGSGGSNPAAVVASS